MRAVWYDRTGPAREVLQYGDRPLPLPAPGEVRVKLLASGVNPADTYRRAGTSYANEFPLIIPNSDGAGFVEALGEGTDPRCSAAASGSTTRSASGPSARRQNTPASRPIACTTCRRTWPSRSAPASASPA